MFGHDRQGLTEVTRETEYYTRKLESLSLHL